MSDPNDWGRDPAVRAMRRVFRGMEEAQRKLLMDLNLSFYDERLRNWRLTARTIFERAWSQARSAGLEVGEERAAVIYVLCLAGRMMRDGIEIPEGILPRDPDIERLIRGITP